MIIENFKNESDKAYEYVTKTNVKQEFGWTERLIKIFMAEPDLTKRNPFYRTASPMLLYKRDRILQIMNSKEFEIEYQKTEKRKESAYKAIDTKLEKTEKIISEIEIDIPKISDEELKERAIYNYEQFKRDQYYLRGEYDLSDTYEVDRNNLRDGFIRRITFNYIRHNLANYDYVIENLSGKVGFAEARSYLKNRIYSEAIKIYPFIKGEFDLTER